MNETIDGHQCLHRALQTHHKIGDHPKPDETQRHVPRGESTTSAQRKQQIGDDQNHVHAEISRSDYGAFLRGHGDCRIDVMMRSIQWVSKEEHPESHHRQKMTEDGSPRGCGNYVVGDGESKRRHEEAYCVVNPEAAECCAARTGNKVRYNVPQGVRKHREDNAANNVPAADIQVGEPSSKKWQDELEDHQDKGKDDECSDD